MIADARENLERYWERWCIAIVLSAVLLYGNYAFITGVSDDLHNFKGAVCTAIDTGRKADVAQADYYEGVAHRAEVRARVEHGRLKQADQDAADTAHHLADAYTKGSKYSFPGCEGG